MFTQLPPHVDSRHLQAPRLQSGVEPEQVAPVSCQAVPDELHCRGCVPLQPSALGEQTPPPLAPELLPLLDPELLPLLDPELLPLLDPELLPLLEVDPLPDPDAVPEDEDEPESGVNEGPVESFASPASCCSDGFPIPRMESHAVVLAQTIAPTASAADNLNLMLRITTPHGAARRLCSSPRSVRPAHECSVREPTS